MSKKISDQTIPKELIVLTESIAMHVHETWAAGRIAQGWSYGKERDDTLKTTPCLVPYEELSEEEKEYDRATALATIQFILESGYEIIKR